jgi:hypothetical protein
VFVPVVVVANAVVVVVPRWCLGNVAIRENGFDRNRHFADERELPA